MSNESNYCALEIELDMARAEEQYINKQSLRWSTHGHRSRQGTTEEHAEPYGRVSYDSDRNKKGSRSCGVLSAARFLREIKAEKNCRYPVVTS